MKLVSMKLSAADKKAAMDGPMMDDEGSDYPYNLMLRLDGDQLKNLGLDGLQVGDECAIEAKGIVTMYREEATSGGAKPDCDAEIQITDLAIGESAGQRQKTAADSHLKAISKPTNGY